MRRPRKSLGKNWQRKISLFTQAGRYFQAESIGSRQQARAQFRKSALVEVNGKYGFEPRRARRGISRVIATRNFREWSKKLQHTVHSNRILDLMSK